MGFSEARAKHCRRCSTAFSSHVSSALARPPETRPGDQRWRRHLQLTSPFARVTFRKCNGKAAADKINGVWTTLPSVEQAQVEGEVDRWRDLDLREIRVSGIYEKI